MLFEQVSSPSFCTGNLIARATVPRGRGLGADHTVRPVYLRRFTGRDEVRVLSVSSGQTSFSSSSSSPLLLLSSSSPSSSSLIVVISFLFSFFFVTECYDASRRPSADAVYPSAETSGIRSQIHFSYFKLWFYSILLQWHKMARTYYIKSLVFPCLGLPCVFYKMIETHYGFVIWLFLLLPRVKKTTRVYHVKHFPIPRPRNYLLNQAFCWNFRFKFFALVL